ncbi:hypothetical protein QF035_009113 [Streptomyces umbrinus]|uniref:Uncharacterized protein n=1 Tax=Streptomyces umbrinus TaxID=67370 RepID=A0ABU0T6W0_9ACTN|nr:DUF6207 family protein [Streptomyces umbrinus]MDQ1031531.1 hypothetical protein [Streptomyces umbrinus]
MHERVLTDVDPIQEAHLSEPGLLVIDAASMDDDTVFAFQDTISRMWGASTTDTTTRDAGQPGVRLRLYVDLRQVLTQTPAGAGDGHQHAMRSGPPPRRE